MSWNVMVLDVGAPRPRVEDLDEAAARPLGPASRVRGAVTAALPQVDWSDPAWGVYDGDGFSLEFNVGTEDPVTSVMVHVRGGDTAVAALASVAEPAGWSVLDISTGDWLDPVRPDLSGLRSWRAFRDLAVGGSDGPPLLS